MDEPTRPPQFFDTPSRDDLAVLSAVVRDGRAEDPARAASAAWNLVGVALARAAGPGHSRRMHAAAPPDLARPFDAAAALAALEEIEASAPPRGEATPAPAPAGHAVGAFNFDKFLENALKIFQVVLPLILKGGGPKP